MLDLVDKVGRPLLGGYETGADLVLVHGRVTHELLPLLRLIETRN